MDTSKTNPPTPPIQAIKENLAKKPQKKAAPRELSILVLGALGVVFGDIGTSPLYTLREAFTGTHGLVIEPASVLGILSLIIWSLIIIVTFQYVILMLSIDNQGEGGIMALLALNLRKSKPSKTSHYSLLILLGLFGASLFYGDGLLTPAISVLSAIEGLKIATPIFTPWVVPMTVIVLLALFLLQHKGTAKVGKLFGPIIFFWFITLAVLGIKGILIAPVVLKSFHPAYAVRFFIEHQWSGFFTLGAVFLAITGAEALYSDMGHFGKKPIRVAWLFLVLPALLLNYLGQGALILRDPSAIMNPFYLLVPSWGMYPMVLLATAATIIASQAIISGIFSVTYQGMQLGYVPPLQVHHTSSHTFGQIYIPKINRLLLVLVIALVLAFQSSTRLASAYGLSVVSTMLITSLLTLAVIRKIHPRHKKWLMGLVLFFLSIDIVYFSANLVKFMQGGWITILVGMVIYLLLSTWKAGRDLLIKRLRAESSDLESFLSNIKQYPPHRVAGTAVFCTSHSERVPRALLHNLLHNKVLHERVIFLTVLTREIPHVSKNKRIEIEALGNEFYRVTLWYGFKDKPNIPKALQECERYGLKFHSMETSFFVGRSTLLASPRAGLAPWREKLFIRIAQYSDHLFNLWKIPVNRIIELGTQVEL